LRFAAALYALTVAVGLSVNAARRGPAGWSHVFDLSGHGSFEASREYLPALTSLTHGTAFYIRHFARLLPYLPTHVKGNPPGPVVVMHLLGITTAGRLTAACILAGGLTAPCAYALGRSLGGERRGRAAGMLTAFSPAVILFGVTSVDYVFAAIATAIAWLLVSGDRRARAAGCALAAVGSFGSWLLLAIPAWAALVVIQRRGWRAGLRLAAGAGAAIALVTLALVVAVGYDPIAILRALGRAYAGGAAAHRPYEFWVAGSPVAWLVMAGPAVAWLAVAAVSDRDPAAVALAVIVVFSAVVGVTKAETERIWLPFVPLACAAAAARPLPLGRLRLILLTLAAQAVAVEVLFGTVW
jgi:methylthioxylose transferase